MTREMIFRICIKLTLIFSGFGMMLTGDCDELSNYLSCNQLRLLGVVLFLGVGWWFYCWLKWLFQHDLDYVRIYDRPMNFFGHRINRKP